jgi:hypothetical protein
LEERQVACSTRKKKNISNSRTRLTGPKQLKNNKHESLTVPGEVEGTLPGIATSLTSTTVCEDEDLTFLTILILLLLGRGGTDCEVTGVWEAEVLIGEGDLEPGFG